VPGVRKQKPSLGKGAVSTPSLRLSAYAGLFQFGVEDIVGADAAQDEGVTRAMEGLSDSRSPCAGGYKTETAGSGTLPAVACVVRDGLYLPRPP